MEVLVGSKAWCCLAVMVSHWATWEATMAVPRPMEMARAPATARQVERRVRSLVHSALRVRRRVVTRADRVVVRG